MLIDKWLLIVAPALWLRQEVIKEARKSVYRLGSSNYRLRLICGSIKSLMSGTR